MDSFAASSYAAAMFKTLYHWIIAQSQSPRAPYLLGAIAFAESSFFPLPPDILLAPMSLAKPRKAWTYALICTLASVCGGVLGYAIGALLYESVALPVLQFYHLADKIEPLRICYDKWGWAVILLKGLTPIPFKIVTIGSGILGYSFTMFLAMSLITRGARFFVLAAILHRYGEALKAALEKHFALVTLAILASIGIGVWLVVLFGGSLCG